MSNLHKIVIVGGGVGNLELATQLGDAMKVRIQETTTDVQIFRQRFIGCH